MKRQGFRRVSSISLSALLISSLVVIANSSVSNASSSGSDEVGAASGSNRFVVWEDATPGNSEIFFRRSTDNGATWQPKVNLSNNPGLSSYPEIAVSGSNVYVVWTQHNAAGILADVFFRRSTDNGATWGAKVNLGASPYAGTNLSAQPHITFFGPKVYVVWNNDLVVGSDVLLRRSTDNGATWKSIQNLSNNSGQSAFQELIVSGSNVYVVWSDYTPENREIFFTGSTDSGATWQSIQNLSNNFGHSDDPQLAVSGSNIYVAWYQATPRGSDTLFRHSTDSGATWESIKILLDGSGGSCTICGYSPLKQMAASGSNVYVVWVSNTPGNDDIFFTRSTDNGVTWKTIVNLSNNYGNSYDPQLVVSGSNVYLVWENIIHGSWDILFRRSTDNGATWKYIRNLSNNAGVSAESQLVVSGSNIYVVWVDQSPGNNDIFFRRSTDGGALWKTLINLSSNAGYSYYPQPAA